jgi:hypothetical protein
MPQYISKKLVPSGWSYRYSAARPANQVWRMRHSIFSSGSASYSRNIRRSAMRGGQARVHPANRELVMYEQRPSQVAVRSGNATIRTFKSVTPSSQARFARLYGALKRR